MATDSRYGRSRSSLRTLLVENASPLASTEEAKTKQSKPPGRSSEDLGPAQRTNRCGHGRDGTAEWRNRKSHFRCLSIHGIGKGAGCKVGACDEIAISENQKLPAMESLSPRRSLPRAPETSLECFSHGISDLIRKKNSKKMKEIVRDSPPEVQFPLPDDLLEICLLYLPFKSLQAARLVCKKWMQITTSPQFLRLRSRDFPRIPWLFLFGVTRDGSSEGEIHALDTSLDRWHAIRANFLARRFFFSVAAVGSEIYVVGGAATSSRSSTKARSRRGVLVFSPLTGKWRKACPMRIPRSGPVVGVLEVSAVSVLPQSRRLKEYFDDDVGRKSPKSRSLLVAAGGRGSSNEPLDSAEIYDPAADRWTPIKNPPADLGGALCSAAAHGGALYFVSESGRLAVYDAESGLWTRISTSSPPPRLQAYRPAVVSCEDRLFVLAVSWGRAEKALRKLWELDLELMAWAEVSTHPDAPMDMSAVFFANQTSIYGIEMFRIFGQVLDFLTCCDISSGELKWKRISTPHFAPSSCSRKSMVVIPL